jgi:hypothetical protein
MKLVSWIALAFAVASLGACSRGSYEADENDHLPSGGSGGGAAQPLPQDTDFALRPEWAGPCEQSDPVDVNLGNDPKVFVRAAQCQINGTEADEATQAEFAEQLRSVEHVRRVDVVRTLCTRAKRNCTLNYSDPWEQEVELTAACKRKGSRELGAVLMYWSECPSGVNCGLDWANTHAAGMGAPSPLLASGPATVGYYNPKNTGFWRRELLDARWSGLQFLALNTFGPDLAQLPRLVQALTDIGGGIQVSLFDDTWGWGKSGQPWGELPSFNDTEAAAQLIYQKWHQFYTAIPSEHWYRYQGRPLIVFYNAGTLKPENKSAATLVRLKELFQAEFGEEPFLAIDRAFFQDPATPNIANAQFRWNTIQAGDLSHSDMNGVTFDHFMAKWDPVGRENNGRLATANDSIVKGPQLVDKYLAASASSNLTMIATWNDLGEGTGLTRNYDYYYQGAWLPPNYFMRRLRDAQCE